jgi:VanZ family protein
VRKQLFFWAAIVWSGIISFFSLVQLNDVPLGSVTNIDKYVHCFFHFVLTTLCFLFFKSKALNQADKKSLLFSFAFSLFFGIGIEIAQNVFTATRQADVLDVLANIVGASLAAISIIMVTIIRKG